MDYRLLQMIDEGYGGGSLPLYCETTGEDFEEICAELEEMEREAEKAKKYYQEVEYPKVLEEVKKLKEEIPQKEREQMRRNYLLDRIKTLEEKYRKTQDTRIPKQISKLLMETRIFLYKDNTEITPQMIDEARNYPIIKLVKHRNYMAVCPFHNDHNPSMNIRNNFYYCHTCGATGDVLDFVMKTENLSFKQVIKKLCYHT